MATTRTFRHAVKWAYLMTWGQSGIALLLTFTLATILHPGDFGTVAMAAAFIVFMELLAVQGIAAAIIQRKDLNEQHLDSAFWMLLAGSLVLGGTSAALSPLWASANRMPELSLVIVVLSLAIPIRGLTVVQQAMLQREMAFRKLAVSSCAATTVGGAVGIALALAGCGVWSLVTQQLVTSGLAMIIMWLVSSWRPRLRFSWPALRSLLGFSGGAFATQIGGYVAHQADVVIIGLCFGPVTLGLYRLAERLVSQLLQVATRSVQTVALPYFSRLQDDPEGLRAAVFSCVRLSATVTIPAMIILACAADQLMALLGERWALAAEALRVLVFLGIAKAVTLFTGPLLMARGRVKTSALLVWAFAGAMILALAVVGAAVKDAGPQRQIVATAATVSAMYVLVFGTASLVVTRRICAMGVASFFVAAAPGTLAALAAALAARLVVSSSLAEAWSPAVVLAITLVSGALAALGTLLLTDGQLRRWCGAALGVRPSLARSSA